MPNVTDTTRAEAWETLRITSWERFGAHLGSWHLLLGIIVRALTGIVEAGAWSTLA